MRRDAARAAEQRKRRDLPQDIVGDDGRRLLDLLAVDHGDARWRIAEPLLAARRRDGDFLEQLGRRQDDFHRARLERLFLLREAAGEDDEGGAASGYPVEGEPPVRTGDGLRGGSGISRGS